MSETHDMSQVRLVSGAVALTIVSAGAIVIGAALTVAVKALSSAARRAFRELSAPLPNAAEAAISPSCVFGKRSLLNARRQAILESGHKLSAVEAAKVDALLSLQAAPLWVSPSNVENYLNALCSADSIPALDRAQDTLFQTLLRDHQSIFTNALAKACSDAAQKIGFSDVRILRNSSSLTRVIANDSAGRYLVAEIATQTIDSEPAMTTEVFNGGDSCHEIMDTFQKALEREGVWSAQTQRKPTGGMCTLNATRELARRLAQPPVPPLTSTGPSKTEEQLRRSRQLNQKTRLRSR